jgi:flagellin
VFSARSTKRRQQEAFASQSIQGGIIMALTVRTNPQSVFARNRLNQTSNALAKTFARLSSGSRINQAADDATGMAISTRLEHRIKGQGAAKINAQEGISFIQTMEGGVEQIRGLLDRIRELAVRAGNETLTASDRTAADLEFQQMLNEIARVGSTTNFNGGPVLSAQMELTFQVGFQNTSDNRITLTTNRGMNLVSLSLNAQAVDTAGNAQSALSQISTALDRVNAYRSRLGAVQNRLERTISNLESDIENAVASNSRIRDVDFAAETSRMTRLQILTQSGTAVLSQANAAPQAALALLGG